MNRNAITYEGIFKLEYPESRPTTVDQDLAQYIHQVYLKQVNQKWNPLGNATDPIPVTLLPSWPLWGRQLVWWARNPFHNFNAYWIGFRYRLKNPAVEQPLWGKVGELRFQKVSSTTTDDYPLVSYRGKWVEWYAGWRPNGMFGVAFRRSLSTGY